jgi:Flp pilus assembly protein TadD
VYEPVGFSQQAIIQVPDNQTVMNRYFEVMDRFVTREIQNRVTELQNQIAESRNNLRYVNRLGVLYARFGRLDDAAVQFEQVVRQREYGPALVNLVLSGKCNDPGSARELTHLNPSRL